MEAHKLLDLIKELKIEDEIPNNLASFIEDCLSVAVKFEFELGEMPILKHENVLRESINLKLPYPICYFEFSSCTGVLAYQATPETKLIGLVIFLKISGQGWAVIPPIDQLAFDTAKQVVVSLSSDPDIQKHYDSIYSDSSRYQVLCASINLMVQGLAALSCSNVVCVDNPPPLALNKKRIKNKKTPLFSYKTLHIKIPRQQNRNERREASSDRNSPRLHLRRGHIRRLSQDQSIWVSSCVVGDATKGIVSKDYLVSRGGK